MKQLLRKIKQFIPAIIQIATIVCMGIYFNRLLEVLIIWCCFFYFRSKWTKQFHSYYCTLVTIVVYFLVINLVNDIALSVLLEVLLSYFITDVSYRYKDYLDLKQFNDNKASKKNKRCVILGLLGGNTSEEYIEDYCNKQGINNTNQNISQTVYLYLSNTLENTADILGVDCKTVTNRLTKFIKESHL